MEISSHNCGICYGSWVVDCMRVALHLKNIKTMEKRKGNIIISDEKIDRRVKLLKEQKLEILALFDNGEKIKSLSQKYGVSISTIRWIVHPDEGRKVAERWKKLKKEKYVPKKQKKIQDRHQNFKLSLLKKSNEQNLKNLLDSLPISCQIQRITLTNNISYNTVTIIDKGRDQIELKDLGVIPYSQIKKITFKT